MPDSKGRKTLEELQAEIDAQYAKQQEAGEAKADADREAASNQRNSEEDPWLVDAVQPIGDVGEAISGVASDVGDWVSGAYDTVAGVNDYRARPYTGAIGQATGHTANLYNHAAEQRGVAQDSAAGLRDAGRELAGAGAAFGDDIRDAAQGYQGDLYDVGDRAMTDAYGYATNLTELGDYGIDSANRYAGGLERRASGLESKGDYYGGALETAATDMMGDPSYAELAGRAAMDRAAQEATARAASARGGNANLMIRDAAGITASGNRGIASDMMAARAREMADRRALQAQTLRSAGDVAIGGRTAGANVYNQAGSTAAQGVAGAQSAYGTAADVTAQGRQQQGNLYQAGTTVGMQGEQGRADLGMRGQEGNVNAVGKAADVLGQGYANSAATMGQAADTSMRGEDITAGSVNAANMANANITSENAKAESDFWKDVATTAGAAMMSDVRAKEDVQPVSFSRSDGTRSGGWLDPWGQMLADAVGGDGEAYDAETGAASGAAAYESSSSVGSGRDLTQPETNRRTLDTVNPYQYRYKPEAAAAMGEDTAPRVGVMAQDLERSPAGSELVGEAPGGGKVIDLNRAASFNLAANAGLNKRLDLLEDDLKAALGSDYRRQYAGPRY